MEFLCMTVQCTVRVRAVRSPHLQQSFTSLLESRFQFCFLFQTLKKSLYERISVSLFHHTTEQNNHISFMWVQANILDIASWSVHLSHTKTEVQGSRRLYLICDGIHSHLSNFLDSLLLSALLTYMFMKRERIHIQDACGLQVYPGLTQKE